jgi:hypothetical protein
MVGRLLLLGLQGLSTAREEKGCGIGGEHSARRAWWMLSLYEMFERERIWCYLRLRKGKKIELGWVKWEGARCESDVKGSEVGRDFFSKFQ